MVTGIAQQLPTLIPMALEAIITIVTSLIDNIDLLIDAAIELIMGLADGLIEAIPILIEKAPIIIGKLLTALINNAPKIIKAGWELIVKLVTGIINCIPKLVSAAGQIISTIWDVLKELPGKALGWGKDMIQGFIDGIKSMFSAIGNAAKGVADKIKNFLHFSRPDEGPLRNYETWMPDMVKGLTKTLNSSSPKLYIASKKLSEKIADGLDITNIYDKMQSTIDFETQKLSTNLTSSAILNVERNDSLHTKLESIDNNREIVVNSKLELDGKVAAKAVNKANAKQKLRYGVT